LVLWYYQAEENESEVFEYMKKIGLAVLFVLLGWFSAALAQDLRIMAPASPGGGWDQTSRSLQAVLQTEGLASAVEVFNVPGAGGTVGLAQLVGSESGKEDILMTMGLVMVGAILTNASPVNLEQVTPIARLTGEYEVIVVPASSEFQTLEDLLTALKADPGAVAWAGGSVGGVDHILVSLVAQAAGVDPKAINYVPFAGGGEALAAILGAQVAAGVSGYGEWSGQIEAGELRVLALSSAERIEGIAAPTLAEQGIDVVLANWRGLVAAPGISDEAKTALLAVVDKAVNSQAWQDVLATNKWNNIYLAGDEFSAFLASEQIRVSEVLRGIGLVE
jgi:putative tricarboxylic transport membrane protein